MPQDIRSFFVKNKSSNAPSDNAAEGSNEKQENKDSSPVKPQAKRASEEDQASPQKRKRQSGKEPKDDGVVTSKYFSQESDKVGNKRKTKGAFEDVTIIEDSEPEKGKKASKKEHPVASEEPARVASKSPTKAKKEEVAKSPVKAKKEEESSKSTSKAKEEEESSKSTSKAKKEEESSKSTAKAKKEEVSKAPVVTQKEEPKNSPVKAKTEDKSHSGQGGHVKSTEEVNSKASKPASETQADPPKRKWNWNQQKQDVPNKHLKEERIDENRGAPNCLSGKTFVITGVLDCLERDEASDLIKGYGGRVTGSVSKKTDFLLCGEEPGDSKVKKAEELKVPKIDEAGLFQLIKSTATSAPTNEAAKSPEAKVTKASPKKSAFTAKKDTAVKKETDSSVDIKSSSTKSTKTDVSGEGGTSLWVDKHSPAKCEDLVGNGDKRETLRRWLQNWGKSEAVSGQGRAKKEDADMNKRAVLITGPPGIGKTSTARLVITSLKYDVVEMNASDVRNKAGIDEKVSSLTSNHSLSGYFSKSEQSKIGNRRTCLIMDEVDGMSGGDRGGVQELINLIKNTRVPIVCIANDYYDKKISSLKNWCLDLRFQKPGKNLVVKRLEQIAREEGFQIKDRNVFQNALEKLVEGANGDIRHVINSLQTWRMRSNELNFADVAEMQKGGKEQSVVQASIFDVSTEWFLDSQKRNNATLGDRLDMFFFDADLIPLLVQENYLKTRTSLPPDEVKKNPEFHLMERMSRAAESISDSDLINSDIRKNQHWSLLPCYGTLATVKAGFPIRGIPPAFYSNELWRKQSFTKILGHTSTVNKKNRLLSDIQRCMKLKSSANKTDIACDYLGVLRNRLVKPLLDKGQNGIQDVIDLLDEYYFTKEEFDSICGELRIQDDKVAPDIYGSVDSKVKASLTRGYKQEGHKIAFVKSSGVKDLASKVKSQPKTLGRSGDMEKEDDEKEESEAEGENDSDTDAPTAASQQKGKKSKGGSSAAKAPASKSKSARGGKRAT